MKIPQILYFLLAFVTAIHALALPTSLEALTDASKQLFKRKGGGGGGGGGRGGGSSSSGSSSGGSRGGSSGSSSSGSSSSSSGSSSGSRGGSAGSTGSTASSRGYGGGSYYGGGAATPYRPGLGSRGGVAPYILGGAALGGLAVFPAVWLYGAYVYNYNRPYTYYNTTAQRNESHPISCLCGRYEYCGCDNNDNPQYLNSVANDPSVAQVANVNGTDRLVINGTLSNDTVNSQDGQSAASGTLIGGLMEMSGYWTVAAGVVYTVMFI